MMDGGMMGLGMLWMVIFWVAIIGLIVWAAVRLGTNLGTNNRPTGSSARSILDERYARGEIDEDEYQQRRRAIAT